MIACINNGARPSWPQQGGTGLGSSLDGTLRRHLPVNHWVCADGCQLCADGLQLIAFGHQMCADSLKVYADALQVCAVGLQILAAGIQCNAHIFPMTSNSF